MYDPKFEKAIQQKMEELEFRPPESLWVNIERAVVVDRRRRIGFFWRYLLPAVLVVAAAGLYWEHVSTAAKPATGKAAQPGAARNAGTGLTSAPAAGSTGEADAANNSQPANSSQTANALQPANTSQRAGRYAMGGKDEREGHRTTDENQPGGGHRTAAGLSASTGRSASAGGSSFAGETVSGDQMPALDGGSGEVTGETRIAGRAGLAGRPQTAQQKGPDAWFYLPGLTDQRMAPQVQASALNTKKASVALAKLAHPLRHWEAGFVAGGGLSRLNRLNSDQAKVALDPSTTSFYTLSSPASNSHYISDVRPEASFEGGIYLQRPLSDRWIFNTGMNLHYYSNRITVGQQVTTYVNSSVSYLAATVQTAASASMYSAGDTRSVINKYYFLELPVGLQWKVNKSHLLPIFVEGGVSLSRLMGASALFYNAKTGLYSKEGDIVNKTQFNLESALLVGLPLHGVNIQLGPQIQYGLTPLVNTQGVGDQHLLYTGIRVVVIPGRK
jgi:hypothetical protein